MAQKVHPRDEDRFQGPVPPDPIGVPSPPIPGPKRDEVPNLRSLHQPPSPSASLKKSASVPARHYSEVIEQLLCNSPDDQPETMKMLAYDSFRLQLPLRPGLAALLHGGALLLMAVLEAFRSPRIPEELWAVVVVFTIAAGIPVAFVLVGLQQSCLFQCPPILLALVNVLPYASGVLGHRYWGVEHIFQYDLLKVASLQLLAASLFRSCWRAKLVSSSSSFLLICALLPLEKDLTLRSELVEGLLLYVVLTSLLLAVGQDDSTGWSAAFRIRKEVSSWSLRSAFQELLSTVVAKPDASSQATRQKLIRQLRQASKQVCKVYELRGSERKCLVAMLEFLFSVVERSMASDVPTLDVRDSPPMVQDWVSQNFARSISVESSLNDIRQEVGVDVKKAQQKYLGKFQHSSSSRSIGGVEPIPEHVGEGVKEEYQADYTYKAIINTMLCALNFSLREGTPSLVSEETMEVLMSQFGNWDFNVVGFSEVLGSQTLRIMSKKALAPIAEELQIGDSSERSVLDDVLQNIESRYHRSNPYHNSVHAADVVNSFAYYLAHFNKSGDQFTPRELFASLLAAAAHDVGHDGKSLRYHTTTESPLALMYNDSSVLEMMHCSIFFAVLRSQGLLQEWEHSERQGFRQQVIRMILDTDLAKHFDQVKKFREKYLETECEEELSAEQRQDILSFMLKLSDIGGSAKPFALHAQWATRIQAEFFLQGDLEREVGLPCSPFCDREVHKVAESQQGFYTYIVKPLYGCLVPFLRSARLEVEVMNNISESEAFWSRYDNTRFNYEDPMSSTSDLVKQFLYRPNRVSSDPVQESSVPVSTSSRVQSQGCQGFRSSS